MGERKREALAGLPTVEEFRKLVSDTNKVLSRIGIPEVGVGDIYLVKGSYFSGLYINKEGLIRLDTEEGISTPVLAHEAYHKYANESILTPDELDYLNNLRRDLVDKTIREVIRRDSEPISRLAKKICQEIYRWSSDRVAETYFIFCNRESCEGSPRHIIENKLHKRQIERKVKKYVQERPDMSKPSNFTEKGLFHLTRLRALLSHKPSNFTEKGFPNFEYTLPSYILNGESFTRVPEVRNLINLECLADLFTPEERYFIGRTAYAKDVLPMRSKSVTQDEVKDRELVRIVEKFASRRRKLTFGGTHIDEAPAYLIKAWLEGKDMNNFQKLREYIKDGTYRSGGFGRGKYEERLAELVVGSYEDFRKSGRSVEDVIAQTVNIENLLGLAEKLYQV